MDALEVSKTAAERAHHALPPFGEGRAAWLAGVCAFIGILGYHFLQFVPGLSAWRAVVAPAIVSLAVWLVYRSAWKHYHDLYYAEYDTLKGHSDA